MKNIIVIGHKNPDTDSICSAIAYAKLKSLQDGENCYIPCRAGQINRETEYVLEHFGIKSPEYIPNAKTRVSDIEIRRTEPIGSMVSLKKAWEQMKSTNTVTLPIADGKKLEGIITIKDIVNAYMDIYNNKILALSKTPYKNLTETLDGEMLLGDPDSIIENGRILIGAGNPEIMEEYIEQGDIIIVSNRSDAQLCAIEMGAGCLIVSNGTAISKTIKAFAEEKNCMIISTKYDSYSVARLINQSAPVGYFMKTNGIVSFREDEYIDDVKKAMTANRYRDFPVVGPEGEYYGMISRRHLLNIEGKSVILVDHNEKAQAADGIEEASVLEIIDHHKLGNIQTIAPIFFRNQPVGCTGTIIEQMYRENGLTPDKDVCALLCSAIISDTLLFKSPTCTPADEQACRRLAAAAEIDLESLAAEMFRAGGSIEGKTAEDILYQDYKTFSSGNIKFGVGQISSTDKESLAQAKKLLLPYIKEFVESHDIEMVCVMLTNIIDESSELIFVGEQAADVILKAFGRELIDDNSVYLPDVVSRKKQLIPAIMTALQA